MQEGDKEYLLGCSGYFYWGWKGRFYPSDLQPKEWLAFYAKHFNTVEINSTFYSFPKKSSLKRLYRETPSGFVITLKMNRAVTHYRKLQDCGDMVREFYDLAGEALGEKLGCILFQLPPSLRFSEEVLERFFKLIDPSFLNVLEPRHRSWWGEEVFEILKERGVIFCSVSMKDLPEDLISTSETVYIRFHGKEGKYRYLYREEEMKEWAERILSSPAKRVFAYFNNDYQANAVKNCLQLMELLGVRQSPGES